jgi:Ca2+-binding EF-hand superfamily protein
MDEFVNGVREFDDKMPAAELQGMFSRGDMNGDGLLDREEFEAMYWEQV